MKKKQEKAQQRGRLIPDGELKCVWMSAGFISYKLCNYQHECEKCAFDRVMRESNDFVYPDKSPNEDSKLKTISIEKTSQQGHSGTPEGFDLDKVFQNFYDIRIKKNIFYHRGHTWVDIGTPDHVTIGIDDFVGRFIIGIKMVVLPSLNNNIDQGQICCWIVGEDGTLPILAPLSGSVLSLNPQISENSNLVNKSPYEMGWLMKIKPRNLQQDMKYLYNDNDVMVQYKRDIEKLKNKFESILKKNWEKVGATLCDGGNILIHVRDMIGPKRYFDITSDFFTGK